MTAASIIAFLAFLSAFNVPTTTVQQVSDILYASQASTTQVIATTTLQVTPHTDVVISTSTPQPVNSQQTSQTFGATIQSMDEITLVTHDLTKENTSWYEAHKDAYPHGYWTIDMSVSVNGTPITIKKGDKPSVIVSMSASDGEADTGPLNSINGNYNDPVFRTFNFAPQAPGTYTITFTYGSTTKDISITAN